MKARIEKPGILAGILTVTTSNYIECSEMTRTNFKRLGLSLIFTILICGSVLAASFCEFWLNGNYYFMPLIFIGTAMFYYILDTAIIMGDQGRGSAWLKRIRIFIALVLAMFNSFLIDYYFFKADIEAARVTVITNEQAAIADKYQHITAQKEENKFNLLHDIDVLQGHLSAQLDSLNAEASGMGGSKHKGIAAVWMAKYNLYQSDSIRAHELITDKKELIVQLNKELLLTKQEKEKERRGVTATVSAGINKSLELLHQIIWLEGKFTNKLMSILILLVSMLLELVPLIAKSFYDTEEYFELAENKKQVCSTNSNIRKRNAISTEAGRLMNENSLNLLTLSGEYAMDKIKEKMNQSNNMLNTTEAYMDALINTEKRWEEKYPSLIAKYGRPIIDKAYETLAVPAL